MRVPLLDLLLICFAIVKTFYVFCVFYKSGYAPQEQFFLTEVNDPKTAGAICTL